MPSDRLCWATTQPLHCGYRADGTHPPCRIADKLDEADTDASAGKLAHEDEDAQSMLKNLNEKVHAIIVINAEGGCTHTNHVVGVESILLTLPRAPPL